MMRTYLRGLIVIFCILCVARGLFKSIDAHGKTAGILIKPGPPEGYVELQPSEMRALQRSMRWARFMETRPPKTRPDYILITEMEKKTEIWRTLCKARDWSGRCFVLTPELCRTLDYPVTRLELSLSERYGEYIPWTEVSRIFPRYAVASVVDVETGLSFKVQRRAGQKHADVQPLTRDDTATMKKIYGGQWSWKRRAVLVVTGSHRIAASMNGMPHGAGAIKGNQFPGHFCIHFRDSRTHITNKIDPEHQEMVKKAAGIN